MYKDYIYKIAASKDVEDEPKNDVKMTAGLTGMGAGTALTKKIYDRGHLTGRETLWHNTDKKNVASIKDKGILSKYTLKPDSMASLYTPDVDLNQRAGKVYLARKKKSGPRSWNASV